MSNYKQLIQKARKSDSQLNDLPERQETKELEVNLCIKVPKSLRQHWAAEAKRQGTTLKAVISQALEERFGLPE